MLSNETMQLSDENRVLQFLNIVIAPVIAKKNCIARELSWDNGESEINQRTAEEVVGLMKDLVKVSPGNTVTVLCTSRLQLDRLSGLANKIIDRSQASEISRSRPKGGLTLWANGACIDLLLYNVLYCEPDQYRGLDTAAVLSLGPLPGKAEDTWQKMVASRLPDITPYQEFDP